MNTNTSHKMYYYMPFEKDIGYDEVELGEAPPGHVVGVLLSFFWDGPYSLPLSMVRVSIYDIGTTKEYIMHDMPLTFFTYRPYHVVFPARPITPPAFIFLDHKVEPGHKLIVHAYLIGQRPFKLRKGWGAFMYVK